MEVLIGARVVQGLGVGGLTALVQVVIASMVSPRERGRYSGYIGAIFALATVSGPLIGGLIVDTPGLGWRWCFFVGMPGRGARLRRAPEDPAPARGPKREVQIDYLGATLLVAGVSLLLVWVSLAGNQFAWISGDQRACWSPRRPGRPRRGGLRRVQVAARADHPAAPLPGPYDVRSRPSPRC